MSLFDVNSTLNGYVVGSADTECFSNLPLLPGGQIVPFQHLLDSLVDTPGELGGLHEGRRLVTAPELGGLLDGVRAVRVLAVFADSHTGTNT